MRCLTETFADGSLAEAGVLIAVEEAPMTPGTSGKILLVLLLLPISIPVALVFLAVSLPYIALMAAMDMLPA